MGEQHTTQCPIYNQPAGRRRIPATEFWFDTGCQMGHIPQQSTVGELWIDSPLYKRGLSKRSEEDL